MLANEQNKKYLDILLEPIKLCSGYTPKFGTSNKDGTPLLEFKNFVARRPINRNLVHHGGNRATI
jgi:hypothetical protein